MAELYKWGHTSPEDRKAEQEEAQFQEWAKGVKVGWVPTLDDMAGGTTIKR